MLRRRGRPRVTPSSLPPGCRHHGRVIQAKVVRHGKADYHSFPLETPNADIIAWQKQAAAELELRYGGTRPVVAGTFAADAERYLRTVSALPDIRGRRAHIALWVELFRDRRRHAIKPAEIRAQRDAWLLKGPKRRYVKGQGWMDLPEGLAPSTVSNRMRALENLWTVLDGVKAYNPVREVPEPKEPGAKRRRLPYDVIEAILAAMPDRGQGLQGQPRSAVSKTKARLRLMAYTGLTHSQVAALKPEHFREAPPAINRKPRSKGAGVAGGWLPVPADAVEAMRAFAAANAWGTFSASPMRDSFKRACAKLGLPTNLTPYQLRHSFSAAVLKQTGDLRAAQMLLQHASAKTTMGYAQDEIDPWLEAAIAKVQGLRQRIAPKPK